MRVRRSDSYGFYIGAIARGNHPSCQEEIDRIARERMRMIQAISQEKLLKELKQRATLSQSTYVEEQIKSLHEQLADITHKLGSLHDYISQRGSTEDSGKARGAS